MATAKSTTTRTESARTTESGPAGPTATTQRLAAQDRHAAAQRALNDARAALDEIRERVAQGEDVTVTALAQATAAVEHATLLADGAAVALSRAQGAERVALANDLAAALAPIVDDSALTEARRQAVDDIAQALGTLAIIAEGQRQAVAGALRAAQDVNLYRTEPVQLTARGLGRQALTLDGRRVEAPTTEDVLWKTLGEAAAAAGWMIRSDGLQAVRRAEREDQDAGALPSWAAFLGSRAAEKAATGVADL
ncbi:hypothetical protein [Cellulomonas xiejunii]|uniref:DUF222 domain-containing protein n=1 Tax=Cellulomonas xiejunii TaxID=2968083 RepID=A0ABY5KVR8_9CELL|nr:hypothetical protein [Cellulomonas xiejunii]MCC2321939.1 hypothetical protein [Cellulomonas xiejunii]UUI73240.1 hypothetical protein NP048_07335 [Cellulomonas xiejunii]